MSHDFQTFLKKLENCGELSRVGPEVDPFLEMGAIADRVSKQAGGGKALLFERPTGKTIPVAMNVFGSLKRMEMALGVDGEPRGLDALADRIEALVQKAMPKPGATLFEKLGKLMSLVEVGSWLPKTVRKGLCQEVVLRGDQIRLTDLPVLTTWPEDGGPFITLGMSHTRNKETGHRNMGLYRLQVYDDRTLGFHTQLHHDGARNRHGYDADERMPVAVTFGGDPALTYAATAPLPPFISEVMFAGFLRGEGIETVRCITNDLEVPADSELVIEGYVLPGELRREVPSAITRATTPWRTTTRCCMWKPSPCGSTRYSRPPSWAARPRRTPTWAWPRSASSSRCCAWCCPRSATCTCPPPGPSTTW